VKLWEIETGRELQQLADGKTPISQVAFAPSGTTLAWGDWRGEVIIWDIHKKTTLHRFLAQKQPVVSLAYSPDSKLLLTGGVYQTPGIWDVDKGKLRTRIEDFHRGSWCGRFFPSGKRVAFWGGDAAIHFWDLETRKEVPVPQGHSCHINSLAISSDGKTAATASWDGIFLWDVATGQKKRHLRTADKEGFWCIALAPDGQTLASGGMDGHLRIWNTASGQEVKQWEIPTGVFGLAYAPTGKTLYSSDFFQVHAWDPKTGERTRRFGEVPPLEEIDRRTPPLSNLTLSPDGKTVLVYQFEKPRFWKADTGAEILGKNLESARPPLQFSPDSRTLVSSKGYDRESLVFWEWASGKKRASYQKEKVSILSFALSPRGRYLAVAGDDGSLRLWEVPSGKEVHVFSGGGRHLAFIPNGRFVLTSTDLTDLLLWDVSAWIKE
jgi:WD40 repeat protein